MLFTLIIVMLSVVMLSVVMLSVVMLSVKEQLHQCPKGFSEIYALDGNLASEVDLHQSVSLLFIRNQSLNQMCQNLALMDKLLAED